METKARSRGKATGFDLEVRSQGGGEGEHDQTRFIGDGFEAAQSDWRWV